MPSGVLIGGADNGNIHVWNAESIVKGTDPVITNLVKHSGAVAALDFNTFQVYKVTFLFFSKGAVTSLKFLEIIKHALSILIYREN